jgi:hypothetical protein
MIFWRPLKVVEEFDAMSVPADSPTGLLHEQPAQERPRIGCR